MINGLKLAGSSYFKIGAEKAVLALLDRAQKELKKNPTLYTQSRIIDFTALSNSINTNGTLLKKELVKVPNLLFEFSTEKEIVLSPLLESVEFIDDHKNNMTWMSYNISKAVQEFLLLPGSYIPILDLDIKKIKSIYTLRLYDFLKKGVSHNQIEISKDMFFNFFNLPASYENRTNLIRKFLIPVLEEISITTNISAEYEFFPKKSYDKICFFPREKAPIQGEELKIIFKEDIENNLEFPQEITQEIKRIKTSTEVSKYWNKRVENTVKKIFQREGKSCVLELLRILEFNLKEKTSETSLVGYIRTLDLSSLKNSVIDNEPEVELENPMDLFLYDMFLKFKEEEQENMILEAKKIYLSENPGRSFEKVQKLYIVRALKSKNGMG